MNLLQEIKVRAQLLARNKDLLQMHKKLVGGGIVSEDDFWRARSALVASEAALLAQRAPMTSSLSSAAATSVKQDDQASGNKKVVLTPAIIKAILTERPAVAKAYKDLVDSTMSASEFWRAYFASRFALEHGINPPADAESNILEPYYLEELKSQQVPSNDEQPLDNLTNLVSTQADNPNHGGFVTNQRTAAGLELMRKFNQHSATILKSSVGERKAAPISSIIEITDLKEEAPISMEADLQINIPAKSAQVTVDSFDQLRNEIANLNIDIRFQTLPHVAFESTQRADVKTIQVPNEIDSWRRNVGEFLRHLYLALPVGSDPERLAKATRMLDMLKDLYAEYQGISEEHRNRFHTALYQSTLKPIEHALSQRDAYLDPGAKRIKR